MFEQVVGTAVAYLDLDATKFNTGLQTAWSQLKGISDQSLTLDQKFQSVGQGLQTVGSQMTRTLTIPIAGAFAVATKKTMDFEEAMSNVKALSGATGEDFDALREKAIELGGSTKFTSKEVADAFGYMALAGWKTEDMINGIAGVLDLAASSGMDLARASDIVTDYLSAFGKEAGYSAHMADMMSYAQANTNTTTEMLGDAFGNSAALMHTAGQEMDTTIALLGMLANEGLKGSEAGTALSATMRDIYQKMYAYNKQQVEAYHNDEGLMSITGDLADVIDVLTIRIGDYLIPVANANGEFRDMVDILADVEKATNGLESAEKTAALQQTFTSRSIKAMSILLTEGADKTRDFREELQGADGTANEMSKTMLDNLAGSITYLTSALDNFLIKVGDRIAPYIRKIADFITELTNKLTSMSDEQFDNMVKIAGTVALLGPALSILGKISSSIGSIIGLFGKFSGAGKMISTMTDGCHGFGSCVGETAGKVGGLGKAFETIGSVVGAVIKTISGIAMVIGGAVLAVKNFFDMWKNGWDAIKTILEAIGIALAAIGAVILGAPALVAGVVAGIVFAVSQLAIVVHDNWEAIKEWCHNLIENIKEGWNNFVQWWKDLFANVGEFFEGVGESIKNGLGNTVDWIKEKWNTFITWWQELGDNIKEKWKNIWEFIGTFFINILENIRNAIQDWFFNTFGENGILSGIPAYVQSLVNEVFNIVESVIALVVNVVKDLFNILVDIFTGNFNKLKDDLQALWDHISGWFSYIVERIKVIVYDITGIVKTFFGDIWNNVTEFFENIWNKITDWFSNFVSSVREFFENLKNNITEKFNELRDNIHNAFEEIKNVINNVITNIKEAFENFKNFIKDIVENIKDTLHNVIENVKNFVKNAVETIKELFANVINAIKELWENVTTFVSDAFSSIFNFIKDSASKLWDWIKEFPKNFVSIGKEIISNLWEGLKSIWDGLGGWLEEKFGWLFDIISKVKDAFGGIASAVGNVINGSHASGLDYVPFDGYVAQLHKGERVLTKQENETYTNGNSSVGGDTFNFYNTQPDPYEYARQMKRAKKELLYT